MEPTSKTIFLKWNQFGTTVSVLKAKNLTQTSNLVKSILEETNGDCRVWSSRETV